MAVKVVPVENSDLLAVALPSDQRFEAAFTAATAKPTDETPWEALEATVVSDESQARRLLDFYRGHITSDVPKAILNVLSHRAARFAGDCFGESAPETIDVLRAVLKSAPDADWAFRPLIVALTMTERWRDVLDAYDARLSIAGGFDRRAEILEEAARIAKDFVGDHARAVGYLEQLFRLRPTDGQVASSLERLLERHERWAELVAARRFRLELLAGAEARELRLRIAATLHEKLAQPDAALAEVRVLLPDLHEDAPLARLLEGLLADERATPATRLDALDALRLRYEATGAGARVPDLLRTAIGFASGDRLRDLRRECGDRLNTLGDVSGALDQYVALIALAPDDRAIEDSLRQLAEAARDPGRLAAALATAAAACPPSHGDRRAELLVRAARVEDRQLGHPERASALFEDAIGGEAGTPELRLESLRRLEEIYDAVGNKARRLDALERLAAVEPKPGGKRFTWALAAELALEIGDVDRALGAWQARLALDPADVEALAAARDLLVRVERWTAVIDLLRHRIESTPPAHQIRADLIEMATMARERLGDVERAIELWREVVTRFGDDDESVGALADLYTESAAFPALADLLSRNANVDRRQHADRLARLADAHRLQLGDAAGAVEWYGRALDVAPDQEVARAGLQALLADASVGPEAARRLAAAAAKPDSWPDSWRLLLDLVPLRLAGATDPGERARILEDAATCADTRAGDQKRALAWLCEALPLAGTSARLEHELLRLAAATGDFVGPARAIGETIAAGGAPPLTLAHLHERRGQLLEAHIGDLAAASESYAAALALTPERLEPRRSLLRTLVRLKRLPDAARLLVDANTSPDARDTALLPLYESLALEAGQIRAALGALEDAVDAAALDTSARRDLHARAATSFIEHAQDTDAAEGALERALAADPRHLPTLLRRADLQRRHPDRRLVDTLTRLAAEQPDNLDFLHEAAEIALKPLGDDALAIDLLRRLYAHAGNLLARDARASGKLGAADAAAHAVDEAVRMHVASGTPDAVGVATTLLLDSARLRVPDPRRWGWLRRAAELTESALDDRAGAIRIWRLLHEQAPQDEIAREALARLYEAEGRFADGVALRASELERRPDQERRLALRLEIVRLGGLLEQRSNAPDVLRASLRERPGHAPTLGKLTDVLVAKSRQAELADILEDQARILEEDGEPVPAAALWADAARLVEGALADAARAMTAWQNAVRLDAKADALDALGRLALGAGQPAAAAEWLDRRLTMTEGDARNEVAARLAGAYVAAHQRHRAIASLERALGEFPRADQLRTMLADFYRGAEAWEPLARVLADGCDHSDDAALMLARASEVAEIYGRLGLLERAVPVLEKAVGLVPQNEALGLALADGLARCGRHDEARAQLSRLVEQAGWRRTRKRAHLHQRLAEIARAQGDNKLALAEFEQASSMDGSNPAILTQLAEVAEAMGDLERAERAYRTLLVQTREDATPHPDAQAVLALTEILLRLYGLARKRGHAAEADELLDSALAAGIKDPDQALRLQRGLLQTGAHDELARLFEKRLARAAGTPAEAEISAEMAESLRAQNKPEAAFDAQLHAVESAPELAALHRPLVEMARACGQVQQLVERLLALVERRRRKADMGVASTLLLLAADVAEHDFGDQVRALDLHRRAEEMQPRSFEVLSGIARLAQQQGNVAECDRVIGVFKLTAAEARTPEAAAEALYRAAGLELGRPETRDAGIADLCEAIEKSRDLERAASLVAGAGVPDAELVKILPLYESIARQSGDDAVLLDYLERRVAASDVTHREVREAVDLAVALHRDDRLEPLLVRLLDIAADRPDGREDATWALFELLRIKKAAGELDAAAQILQRATELLPLERVVPLARDLAERAGRSGNRRLGAELLERLRATAPADESVWRPLLDHYVSLRDRDGLARLVAETLPLLPEVAQRNELRMALARLQLAEDAADSTAAVILQDILLEAASHEEALALLAGYYERSGSEGDLVDLLTQAFDTAIAARDPETVVAAAIRLGGVLERKDAERAAETYERALTLAPRRGELLKRVLALRPSGTVTREHAELVEAVLDGETGAEAARLARELAEMWTTLGEMDSVRRVLEKGYAQTAGEARPSDAASEATSVEATFFEDLTHLYRTKQDWAPLANLYASEAERREDATAAAALYVEAASLRRGRLADVKGGLELLRRARTRAPHDITIVEQLSRALVAHGELGAAVAEVRAALDDARVAPEHRLPLHLLRAKLEGARGDHRAAVSVLEEAFTLSREAATPALMAELEAWRTDAVASNAAGELREATLRLVELARGAGDAAQARRLLDELVARGAADADTVRLTWELAEAEGDTEGAFSAAQQYLRVAEGEAQIAAAGQLVALAERIGKAPDAAAAIEAALAAHPDQVALYDLLAPLYEQTGQLAKLAGLVMDQANRTPDEEQRFQQLRRAGAFAVQAQDASLAVMALNEALGVRPTDEETVLLLSDAYVLAGAIEDAAALIRPLVAARKGKASPALATMHVRLAHISGLAGDRAGQLAALGHALDADKKNGELAAEVADRAEEAGDDEVALKALRLIVAHNAPGPITVAEAFLRQARIAQRRGETERAVMFARRASHDAAKGDPVHAEARAFIEAHDAPPSRPPPVPKARK